MSSDSPPCSVSQNPAFATTRWSVVLAAGQQSSPDADAALASLCRTYWYPLYAYSRRRGYSAEDAQDLTQEFFARLLDRELLRSADQQRGKFRTFLLTAWMRFLSKDHDRRQARKRGGGAVHFSIDVAAGEDRYRMEPIDQWTPEKLFERRWALTLLEQVLVQLREDYLGKGKGELFERCKKYLTGDRDRSSYTGDARVLGVSESALRVTVHRMRQRYRELLQKEVGQTVDDPRQIDAEIEYLRAAIRGENC